MLSDLWNNKGPILSMKNSPKYILTLVVCALLSWRAVAAESGDWLGLLPRPVSVERLGGE